MHFLIVHHVGAMDLFCLKHTLPNVVQILNYRLFWILIVKLQMMKTTQCLICQKSDYFNKENVIKHGFVHCFDIIVINFNIIFL